MNDVELWDLLQNWFGFGDYDVDLSQQQWFEFRNAGISRLRATLKRRNLSVSEALVVAQYVRSHGIPVTTYNQMFQHYHAAVAWSQQENAIAQHEAVTARVALVAEVEGPQSEWVARLMRATTDQAREKVLTEWQTSK